jgi:hypothetical protein
MCTPYFKGVWGEGGSDIVLTMILVTKSNTRCLYYRSSEPEFEQTIIYIGHGRPIRRDLRDQTVRKGWGGHGNPFLINFYPSIDIKRVTRMYLKIEEQSLMMHFYLVFYGIFQ